MQLEGRPCADCGRIQPLRIAGTGPVDGTCPVCKAPLDGGALSKFADRLAQFGLGATPQPLLKPRAGAAE